MTDAKRPPIDPGGPFCWGVGAGNDVRLRQPADRSRGRRWGSQRSKMRASFESVRSFSDPTKDGIVRMKTTLLAVVVALTLILDQLKTGGHYRTTVLDRIEQVAIRVIHVFR